MGRKSRYVAPGWTQADVDRVVDLMVARYMLRRKAAVSWTCYEHSEPQVHPGRFNFCPKSGAHRSFASQPTPAGIPPTWVDNPAGWDKFKAELDGLSHEELRMAGLRRVTESE